MADGGFPVGTAGMAGSGVVPLSGVVPGTNVQAALGYPPSTGGGSVAPGSAVVPSTNMQQAQAAPVPGPGGHPAPFAPAPLGGQQPPMTGPVGGAATPVGAAPPAAAPAPLRPAGGSSGGADLLPNLASEEGRFPVGGGAGSATPGLPKSIPMKPEDADHHRHWLCHFYTIALFCLFGAPTIMLWTVGNDVDAQYWISSIGIFAWLVPAFIVGAHYLQVRAMRMDKPVPKWFFLVVVLVPAIFFFFAGAMYWRQGKSQAASMHGGEGCKGDDLNLNRAYLKAESLWNACVVKQAKLNGDQPLMALPKVQSCPNYIKVEQETGFRNWKGYDNDADVAAMSMTEEWRYLALAEVNHICAGWCDIPNAPFKPRLWSGAGTPAEPCQNFVAHKMLVIEQQGWIVMWVATWIMVFSCAVYLLFQGMLVSIGHH